MKAQNPIILWHFSNSGFESRLSSTSVRHSLLSKSSRLVTEWHRISVHTQSRSGAQKPTEWCAIKIVNNVEYVFRSTQSKSKAILLMTEPAEIRKPRPLLAVPMRARRSSSEQIVGTKLLQRVDFRFAALREFFQSFARLHPYKNIHKWKEPTARSTIKVHLSD